MSFQKLSVAVIVVAVVAFLLDYLFYGIIMGGDMTAEGMREEPNFVWMIISYFIFAIPFVYLYSRAFDGHSSKVMSGLKFGLVVSVLTFIFWNAQWMGLFENMTTSQMVVDDIYKLIYGAIIGIVTAYMTGLPTEYTDRGPGKETGSGATPPPPTGGDN